MEFKNKTIKKKILIKLISIAQRSQCFIKISEADKQNRKQQQSKVGNIEIEFIFFEKVSQELQAIQENLVSEKCSLITDFEEKISKKNMERSS